MNHPLLLPHNPAATCEKKRRHPDEATARAFGVFHIQTKRNQKTLYTYRCQVCHGWHLTRFKVSAAITENNPFFEEDDALLQTPHR